MTYHMYVSLQGDDKILRFIMNPETGKLSPNGELAVAGGPAPMAVDPQQQFLYVGRRGVCELSSFSVDASTGDLTHIGAVSLDSDPCYIATIGRGIFYYPLITKRPPLPCTPLTQWGLSADRRLSGGIPRVAHIVFRPILAINLPLYPILLGKDPTRFGNLSLILLVDKSHPMTHRSSARKGRWGRVITVFTPQKISCISRMSRDVVSAPIRLIPLRGR